MLGLTWLAGLLRRRTGRMVGQVTGVALAVLLLAALGTFFTTSRARMTTQAVRGVPVDWQVQLSAGTSVAGASVTVAAAPGVAAALPVGYAATSGLSSRSGGAVHTTGPGVVLGLPPGYSATFPGEIRRLVGASDGVLLGAADGLQPRCSRGLHHHDRPTGSAPHEGTGGRGGRPAGGRLAVPIDRGRAGIGADRPT